MLNVNFNLALNTECRIVTQGKFGYKSRDQDKIDQIYREKRHSEDERLKHQRLNVPVAVPKNAPPSILKQNIRPIPIQAECNVNRPCDDKAFRKCQIAAYSAPQGSMEKALKMFELAKKYASKTDVHNADAFYHEAEEIFSQAEHSNDPIASLHLGLLARHQGNHEKANNLFSISATQKDGSGNYELSQSYRYGLGCNPNQERRFYWLKRAASSGHLEAQLELRLEQLHKTAEKGDADAQFDLGRHYKDAYKKDKNENSCQKALHYLRLAARQGHSKAMYERGLLLFRVAASAEDYKKAIEVIHQAATVGIDPWAQYEMGKFYKEGLKIRDSDKPIVSQNLDAARKYFQMAAAQGHEEARLEVEPVVEAPESLKPKLQSLKGLQSTLQERKEKRQRTVETDRSAPEEKLKQPEKKRKVLPPCIVHRPIQSSVTEASELTDLKAYFSKPSLAPQGGSKIPPYTQRKEQAVHAKPKALPLQRESDLEVEMPWLDLNLTPEENGLVFK